MASQAFYNALRSTIFHGVISNSQVEGCESILAAFSAHMPGADPRWVAYALATAFHETASTMQPIEEIGHGRGLAYGHPAGPWHLIYDGRGDVQLTWLANYQRATTRLRAHGVIGDDVDLARSPDLAMRPDIAAAVMVFGMAEGWFTGRKFADFFIGTRADWVDARAIINGHDRAALIAGYALHFYHALTS